MPIDIIVNDFKNIFKKIKKKLQPLIFKNNFLFPPWELDLFIKTELEVFLVFLKTQEKNICIERGKYAAIQGINIELVYYFFEVIKNFFKENILKKNFESLFFILDMIDVYKDSYQKAFFEQIVDQKDKEKGGLYDSLIVEIENKRKEILEKEKEQNRQRTAFLINFAHETKLPLTIIQNQINMIIEEAGNRQLQTVPALEEQIKELQEMVGNILDYEKILQGKILYDHNIIVNLSKMVVSKVELFKVITDKTNITMSSDIEPELYIRIAPLALDRILNNILDNAVKYNQEKGSIHVKVNADDTSVFFIVQDTGIGIPSDQLKHIFKPYYQSTHKTRSNQGIGAGLSLVKSILAEISGDIHVESDVTKGTIVTITFKQETISEDNKDVANDIKLSKPIFRKNITFKSEVYDDKKKTILFVEDNTELLSYLQKSMINDFNFYYAINGRDALKKLEIMPKPDAIISDIMMDIMDGYEFLEKLREKRDLQDIPFIFLTAKTTEEDKLKGLKYGAVDYIEKPFSFKVLKEKINSLIRDHTILSEKEIERMEKRLLETIRTKESQQIRYDRLYTKYGLSEREREIVVLIVKGIDLKDIAEKLCLSYDTVKTHFQHIKGKCNVKNKVQLANLFHK